MIKKILLYSFVILVMLVTLFPFYWILNTSLQRPKDIFSNLPSFVPSSPNFGAYKNLFRASGTMRFSQSLINTVVVGIFTTFICVTVGSIAAYSLARLKFRGVSITLLIFITTQMLPPIALMIPIYLFLSRLQLIDTKISLVIGYTSWIMPVCIWILYGYFKTIPKHIEDAARIDGCSRFSALIKVVLPISIPGIAAATIFAFISSINEFLYALVVTATYHSKTMPVVLSEFVGKYMVDYVGMSAGTVIAAVFPIILALIFQKYLIRGLTAGAIKG